MLVSAAAFNYPSRSTDMVTIVLVMCDFVAVLLLGLPSPSVAERFRGGLPAAAQRLLEVGLPERVAQLGQPAGTARWPVVTISAISP